MITRPLSFRPRDNSQWHKRIKIMQHLRLTDARGRTQRHFVWFARLWARDTGAGAWKYLAPGVSPYKPNGDRRIL